MSAIMKRAQMIGIELEKVTEELNRSIATFEDKLNALNLGVTAHVELPEPTDDIRVLTFERIGAKWCIAVSAARGDIKPLLNASRAVRIQASQHLTLLLSALVANAERTVDDVRVAKSVVDEAVEHLVALEKES